MKVEMKGIVKSFGSNNVLKKVDFSVCGGEICALLGENGAGKSTLMNILGGVLAQDGGTIEIDGKPVVFTSPAQSLGAGIAFIHQELNLINDLPVYENMFIGREIKKKSGFLDHAKMYKETKELFEKMEIDIDPGAMVSTLDASFKQIVEISRALMMNASIIIMDEPTSSLTEPEIERVFEILRTLKDKGVGVVFISHKLGEVMEICDRYTVLRDGVMVAVGKVSDTTAAEIAYNMVGHEVHSGKNEHKTSSQKEVLRLENLTNEPFFRDVSLCVNSGEVVGVTGLLGDGRSELFSTVFGALGKYKGKIFVKGNLVNITSTRKALKLGIGYVPRNRKENGIIKDMSILENGSIVTLSRKTRFGLINSKAQKEEFERQRTGLQIKLDKITDLITSLSGGNQQKVVLAKWLCAHPDILILDNPTQGVDVGAKEEIYEIILELASEGMAVVVLSNEAQEIIRLCDRTFVMYHGNIRAELKGQEMTEFEIMRIATGGEAAREEKVRDDG